MAKVVGRARPQVEGSTSMKLSEVIIIGFVLAGLVAGGIYYYQYRQTATYALGNFLGAVNHGRVKDQYELIDDGDKQYPGFESPEKYEVNDAVPLGLGYGERIPRFRTEKELPYAGHTDAVTIKTTMDVVDGGGTKNLTDVAASKPYTDNFVMHKDKDGHWKVWLSETFKLAGGKLNLMQSAPSPRSTY